MMMQRVEQLPGDSQSYTSLTDQICLAVDVSCCSPVHNRSVTVATASNAHELK